MASQVALRNCSQQVREKPGYIGVSTEKKKVAKHEKIIANHKNQASQVKDLSAFLYGKIQDSGLIEIIPLMCILAI